MLLGIIEFMRLYDMWYWIALSLIPIAGFICGIVEFFHERKHGKKEKSGIGFWVVIFAISELLDCFSDKKKKK